jgi:hypothetical protein
MDIWDIGFDGVLFVLGGVHHCESEEDNDSGKLYLSVKFGCSRIAHTYHKTQAEANSPNTVIDFLMVAGQDNQRNDTGNDESQVDSKVGGRANENSTVSANHLIFIRRFGSTCTTGWVFSSGSETSNTSSNNHHPEHTKVVFAMGCSSDNHTQEEEESGNHDTSATSKAVNGETQAEHTEDFTNEVGVGQTGQDL